MGLSEKYSAPRLARVFAVAGALGVLAASWPAAGDAQEPNPTSVGTPAPENAVTQKDGIFIYRVKVVQRDLDAVNYLHRSGSTTIGFEGTPLLARAKGEVALWESFDYVILNDDFDRAYADLAHVYHAERLRRTRNPWVRTVVQSLLDEVI